MKTFAREYFESLPEEEKLEFLKHLSPEVVWKMAEGNPTDELKGDLNIIVETVDYASNTNSPQLPA